MAQPVNTEHASAKEYQFYRSISETCKYKCPRRAELPIPFKDIGFERSTADVIVQTHVEMMNVERMYSRSGMVGSMGSGTAWNV